MKIREVRTRVERLGLARPYTIAFRRVEDVSNGIIELVDDEGRIGRGAASPESHVTGETWEQCAAALDPSALRWLEGRDPRHLGALCREVGTRMTSTPAARAAVDIALHDLHTRIVGVPLVDWFGRCHSALPTSVTIGILDVEKTVAEAVEFLERGFRVLKVKLGHDLETDLRRLAALRDRFGDAPTIRVDANQGYDLAETRRFFERATEFEIEFVEQPMAAADRDALRALPAALRSRVAADETLLNEHDALALLQEPRACGIFNIKLMKCGGLWAARRIAELAETAGVELMWGCMDESVLSISAALHLALACPATRYLDLDGSLDLARDVAEAGFRIRDGMLELVEDQPGTGCSPLGG